jgi:hypothetical protein
VTIVAKRRDNYSQPPEAPAPPSSRDPKPKPPEAKKPVEEASKEKAEPKAPSEDPKNVFEEKVRTFLGATVEMRGTDEKLVDETVQWVHDHGLQESFEKRLRDLIPLEKQKRLLGDKPDRLVPAILEDELSWTQLARAMDLYNLGKDTYRSSNWKYFLEGLLDFDLSERNDQYFGLALGAMVVGLAVFTPLTLSGMLGSCVLGYTAVQFGHLLKNGYHLLKSDSPTDSRKYKTEMFTAAGSMTKGLLGMRLLGRKIQLRNIFPWDG